ncbi:Bifunctional IPC transferase and DIPP synthase, partial [Haemophilus influenzae]
PFRWNI